jgi:hypothetical protein
MVKPPAMGLAIMVQVRGLPGTRRLWEQISPRAKAKSRKLIGSVYYTSGFFPIRSLSLSIKLWNKIMKKEPFTLPRLTIFWTFLLI